MPKKRSMLWIPAIAMVVCFVGFLFLRVQPKLSLAGRFQRGHRGLRIAQQTEADLDRDGQQELVVVSESKNDGTVQVAIFTPQYEVIPVTSWEPTEDPAIIALLDQGFATHLVVIQKPDYMHRQVDIWAYQGGKVANLFTAGVDSDAWVEGNSVMVQVRRYFPEGGYETPTTEVYWDEKARSYKGREH